MRTHPSDGILHADVMRKVREEEKATDEDSRIKKIPCERKKNTRSHGVELSPRQRPLSSFTIPNHRRGAALASILPAKRLVAKFDHHSRQILNF
jgi:hypothetical protein